jgi:ribosomal protein S18 acetylase RimI-like enzyme
MNQLPNSLLTPPADAPAGLSFRLAARSDLGVLHARFYAHQPLLKFRNYFQRVLTRQQSDKSFWVVAEIGQLMVGSGLLVIYAHGAELANLRVAEKHREQGIGTALIHVLTCLAKHVGLASVEIGVAADNGRALALYQRLGFAEDRWLHLSQGEPAIILRKEV